MSLPHDSWARYYDLVLHRTFPGEYQAFTDRTLGVIRSVVSPPARIVDFGAGTGRLAVPLADEGYRVTAVDPSAQMLAALEQTAGAAPIEVVCGRMEDYSGESHRHDLALCVFTVLVHMLDEDSLSRAFAAAAAALRPDGFLLVDLPSAAVFEGFEFDTADVIRCVDIEPMGASLFRYHETTAVMVAGTPTTYEDEFEIRYWEPAEIRRSLGEAGFRVREDLSHDFRSWGAGYLLLDCPA